MIISMSTQCLCSKRSRIHEKRMLDIYQIQHPLTSARLILILSLQTELLIPNENPYTCLCVSTTSPNHTHHSRFHYHLLNLLLPSFCRLVSTHSTLPVCYFGHTPSMPPLLGASPLHQIRKTFFSVCIVK